MIDVAIVNWNTPERAVACARTFGESHNVDVAVTVADNCGTPEGRERLRKTLPSGITLLALERNEGFGVAANRALSNGVGEFICVSNADVQPDQEMLSKLVEICRQDRSVGLAGPRFDRDDSTYHSAFPARWALLVRPFLGRAGTRRAPVPADNEAVQVDQPAGACFVSRRALWDALGGFDESFFLWYEDVDLARRVQKLGYRSVIVGAAVASHVEGDAARSVPGPTTQAIRLRSLRRYIEVHHPRLLSIASPVLVAAVLLRVGVPGSWEHVRSLLAGPSRLRWRRVIRPVDDPASSE